MIATEVPVRGIPTQGVLVIRIEGLDGLRDPSSVVHELRAAVYQYGGARNTEKLRRSLSQEMKLVLKRHGIEVGRFLYSVEHENSMERVSDGRLSSYLVGLHHVRVPVLLIQKYPWTLKGLL